MHDCRRDTLRPQAGLDLHAEVKYFREVAGEMVAKNLATAHQEAMTTLQRQPGIGSPRVGELLEFEGLRSWRMGRFPLVWSYFEHDDYLDFSRLLGERQDMCLAGHWGWPQR